MKAPITIISLSCLGSCFACSEGDAHSPDMSIPSAVADAGVASPPSSEPASAMNEPESGTGGKFDATDSTADKTAEDSTSKPDSAQDNPTGSEASDSTDAARSPSVTAEPEARLEPAPATETNGEDEDEDELLPPLGSRNFACQPSESPMYQSQEILKMWISGDFTQINTAPGKDEAKSTGLLDPDGPGPLPPVELEILARGHSRFLECGYRPFKVRFSEKQKDNVFHHLGKTVKFSTHCGDRDEMAEFLKAPSLDEYHQRVRMEHAIYQIVDTLDTMSLKTRLVELTYHDTATDTEETHLAFVREPEDELAQRCGMVEEEDIPLDVPTSTNTRAELLLFLVNNFVLQADVKNKFEMVDVDQQLSALVPYDFDLVGVFRRDFFKLKGRSLEENNAAFADWLRRNQSSALREEVDLIVTRSGELRTIIDNVGLNAANHQLFAEWYELFMNTLRDFQACETLEDDPSSVDCHVPDDYPDTIEDAPTVALGEHSVWLEPPGDLDIAKVEVEANVLYSLVTRADARLLIESGEVVQEQPATIWGEPHSSFSVLPNASGAYYLEFDHGDSLVCSDIWVTDLSAQAHGWAFYEDDHGNTPALATRLNAGTSTQGLWELDTLQNVFDEDWFALSVTESTELLLHFEGGGAGRIDSFKREAPAELIGYADIFPPMPETSDISSIFPEPGDYLVRILQDFGEGSYTLELR